MTTTDSKCNDASERSAPGYGTVGGRVFLEAGHLRAQFVDANGSPLPDDESAMLSKILRPDKR